MCSRIRDTVFSIFDLQFTHVGFSKPERIEFMNNKETKEQNPGFRLHFVSVLLGC